MNILQHRKEFDDRSIWLEHKDDTFIVGQNGGKAEVFIDGNLHRKIDTYYWWAGEDKPGAFLWHILNLEPGEHTVKLVVLDEKKDEATGSNVYITGAAVFTSIDKNTIL